MNREHPDSGRATGGIVEQLHARIAELEAQLDLIGAGGVNGPLMAQAAGNAGSEAVESIYQLSPPASAHDTITEVIKELRTYNPQGDEHGGKFIHKGWANQLEAVAPPKISESDAAYWVRNRALILRAIEDRGFRLVSSGGLFWLSGTTHPSPPEGMVMVPKELTPEMKRVAMDVLLDGLDIYMNVYEQVEIQTTAPARLWASMIAAAPGPADGESNG